MFKEAIDSLTNSKPMNDLVLNDDISIDLPTEKEYNNDKDFFKKKILKQKKIKKSKIKDIQVEEIQKKIMLWNMKLFKYWKEEVLLKVID